jgi:hypothetical protein
MATDNKEYDKIVNFVVGIDAKLSDGYEELDKYLLQGYRVIDIITDVLQTSGRVSITVLLSKSSSVYRSHKQ